ncbi:MAG: uroporphyrinogen-III synthase [Mariprofundaceae bacterium]|nr:uroporphyrinogen-III synthase [Mariprofundaceae bacterium]
MLMQDFAGKYILVTRAADQFAAVAEQIQKRGGTAISFPCLAVQCLPDNIRRALNGLSEETCILLTSANGVHCVAKALGDDVAMRLGKHPVVAIGPRTAAALIAYDVTPAWVADEASQEGVVHGFARCSMPKEICFLRAEQGRDVVRQALQAAGVQVRLVSAYRTVCPTDDASAVVNQLKIGAIDGVLLGSSRCAEHYVQRIGDLPLADRPPIAVISQQVARAAEHAGLSVQCVAKETSFTGMLDALAEYFADNAEKTNRTPLEEERP